MARPRPEYLPDMRSFAFGDYVIFFRYHDNVFEVVSVPEDIGTPTAIFAAKNSNLYRS